MKKKISDLSEQEKIVTLDTLYTAASGAQGRTPMKLFLRDLLTESERIMLGRRIIIARLLLKDETLESIRKRTGAGFGTIGRVRLWLKDQLPGYETAVNALETELSRREYRKQYGAGALSRLKKKYPLHFLLFPESKSRR